MKRTILLTAAGLLSAAVAGAGCEQDRSSSSSSRMGSAKGETMQATGQPGTGAKRGTGTTASGVTTGTATTGAPTAAGEASGNQTAKGTAAAGDVSVSASRTGDASASASAKAEDQSTAVGVGLGGINEAAATDPAADAARPAAAEDKKDDKDDDAHHAKADAWAKVKPAGAAPKDMQVTGTVSFAKAEHGVMVSVDLKGLTPNAKHGFHIHEKGDLSDPKLTSAGPHFNPTGKKHGGPKGDERHGGDLGNITADAKGNAKAEIMAHGVTLDGEKDGIVGRSIIVHAKPDDEKSDPSGNSGDRIAGGVIEKSKDGAKSADAGTGDSDARTASDQQPADENAAVPSEELNK